ncbi:site-specific integrase [Vagococcus salmoninarum]|uniref:site-specific integrase n=1 Tax=Vagococcus salmoninarum TaxID=2739 RepID=UPI003F96D6E9
MSAIQKYTNKKGTFYKFQLYVGTDPITGRRIKTTRSGFKTKKEATLSKSRLQLEIEKNGFKTQVLDTYQDVYYVWVKNYENTVKESTFVKTERLFRNHILPYFSEMRIEKIDILTCQKFINQLFKKLKRFKMTFNYASLIFDYALTLGLIDKNPCSGVTVPIKIEKHSKVEPANFYNKQEVIHFLECMKSDEHFKAYTLFRVLAYTGMRKGELLALTWKDINFKDCSLSINKTLSRGKDSRLVIQTPKTKNSFRSISLDDETLAVLQQWRKIQKKEYMILGYNTLNSDQLVFSNEQNSFLQPTKTRKWLVACQNKYDLKKITTHGFRHTHCSLLFEAGVPLERVQERLGHSDIQTTMNIYTHVSEKSKEKTALDFANYMNY